MALINHRAREIHFKIVYVGPALGGKTTNLRILHDRLPPEKRGRLVSISTDHERTLFFDFLPIDLGQVNGFTTRFHLYTVPGQVYYKLSRRAVLQGLDGIVFVADSHPARESANRESLADVQNHLETLGFTADQLSRIPWVFQYNKRDLAAALPVERLRAALNLGLAPEFESTASEGRGVTETLRSACKLVLARLAGAADTARSDAAVNTSPAPRVPSAPAPAPTPAPEMAAAAALPQGAGTAPRMAGVAPAPSAASNPFARPAMVPKSSPAVVPAATEPHEFASRTLPPAPARPALVPNMAPAAPQSPPASSTPTAPAPTNPRVAAGPPFAPARRAPAPTGTEAVRPSPRVMPSTPPAPARPYMPRPRIQTAPRRPWPGSSGGGNRA